MSEYICGMWFIHAFVWTPASVHFHGGYNRVSTTLLYNILCLPSSLQPGSLTEAKARLANITSQLYSCLYGRHCFDYRHTHIFLLFYVCPIDSDAGLTACTPRIRLSRHYLHTAEWCHIFLVHYICWVCVNKEIFWFFDILYIVEEVSHLFIPTTQLS